MSAAGDAAELRGSELARQAINQMLTEPTQGERLTVLLQALVKAAEGPYPSRALAGFAVAVIPLIERGLDL